MIHNCCLSLPRVIAITMLFWVTSTYAQPHLSVHQGSIEALQAEASRSQRPYLLYFYADWSEPCLKMESTTYQHPKVVEYLNQRYLFHRVDVSSRGAQNLPRSYSVFLYPTLVVCSPSGEVIDEISGYISAETLIEELQAIETSPRDTPPTPSNSQNASLGQLAGPAPEATLVVQVGVYGHYANVQSEVNRLQRSYQQPVRALSGNLNGSTIHRVVVGPFASRAEAQQFLRRFQLQENRAALIKDLRDL